MNTLTALVVRLSVFSSADDTDYADKREIYYETLDLAQVDYSFFLNICVICG
jgi:hypothetical protein